LKITPRDFNRDFDKFFLVTNSDPANHSTNKFNIDGVFSEKVFGKLGNGIDYSCNCGHLEGEFNLGVKCTIPTCNSKVEFKGLNLAREGWIDLNMPIFHPLLFRYIKKIISKPVLDRIIAYKAKVDKNGHIIHPEFSLPYEGIGMISFIENFELILSEFLAKKKNKNIDDYNFIEKYKDLLFIEKFPIINAKLRPALMINNDLDYHEINNHYNGLIKNSNILKNLSDVEVTEFNVNALLAKNQELANNIFDSIIAELSNKGGYIRNNLFGNRVNFSSRLVITPLSGEFSMDEIVLPYVAGMELLKPSIIRKIKMLKKVNTFKASQIWSEGLLKFDKFLHKIMTELIKSPNIRILLNRNPTLSLGSILLLKIHSIKTDYSDLTSSINNLILPLVAADFDGDVLNHILIYSKEFVTLFDQFRPCQLIIDPIVSEFNSNFLPFKDISLGLQTFIN
jgi:DNA-directed RNA polymerase beta' subunit